MILEQTIMVEPPQTRSNKYEKFTVNKLCKRLRDRAGFTGHETYMLAKHGTIITLRGATKIKYKIILEGEHHDFTGTEFDLTADNRATEGTTEGTVTPTSGGDEVHN